MIEYQFKKGGCRDLSYGSIVATGKNATVLHYKDNNEVLRDGDLILIDAGGSWDYYAADITRTWPVGNTYNKEQAAIYDLVLKAQKECIEKVKPGHKLMDLHNHACNVLIDGLLSLGLLKGKRGEILKDLSYKRFFPHGTSHWIGLDVHDTGLYRLDGEPRKLEPGMVFSIEPGIYCQVDDPEVPERYRGIGVRIEDDVLVTPKGYEVFSSSAVKERPEIEKLRG